MIPQIYNAPLWVEAYLMPFATAFLLLWIMRLTLGPRLSVTHGGLAVGVAVMAFFFDHRGWPIWPPAGSTAKIPYILLAGLVFGALLDGLGRPLAARISAIVALSLLAVFWLGFERFGAGATVQLLPLYAVAAVASVLVLARLDDDRRHGLTAPITLFAGCLGLFVVAEIYGSRVSLYAGALAAALAAFAAWNVPRQRFEISSSLVLGAGAAYVALAIFLFFSRSSLEGPVGLTVLPFLIIPALEKMNLLRRPVPPLLILLLSLPPIVAAGYVAYYYA